MSLRRWVTETVPDACSAWLLRAYRRPLRFLLTAVVLPLVLLFATVHAIHIALWQRHILHNLHVTARLASEIVDETLEETLRFGRLTASHREFTAAVQARDADALRRQLEEAISFLPRVDRALVADPDGHVISAYPATPDGLEPPVSGEEPFESARRGGWHPYVSAVYLRQAEPIEKVVSVVLPLEAGGQVVGVLQLQHRVETVKAWLQKLRVEPEGFLYVTDHRDQLVVFPFQVLAGTPKVVADWPPVAAPLGASGTSLRFEDSKHRPWLAGVHPVGETGWRVVAVQPERAALRVLDQLLLLMGSVVFLLALLLSAFAMRWARLQDSTMQLLRQNTKLLKQMQQKRTLGRKEGEE